MLESEKIITQNNNNFDTKNTRIKVEVYFYGSTWDWSICKGFYDVLTWNLFTHSYEWNVEIGMKMKKNCKLFNQ